MSYDVDDLIVWAREAVANANTANKGSPEIIDPNSNNNTVNQISITVAKEFLSHTSTKFLSSPASEDDDRLVKIGRSVADLVNLFENDDYLESSLSSLVEECDILASDDLKVPKVRFGRTNLQMPIVTLGCMRFQQAWGPSIQRMDQVVPACQSNVAKIVQYAVQTLGINHIETARGYGCSELQLGEVFQELFDSGAVKREDLIIQTKVAPMAAKNFRATLEKSFSTLKMDYVDLFSFHGVNMDFMYDLIFDNGDDENLIDIVKEYQTAGRIRHIGFSTHGRAELTTRLIETDQFDYANVHYHAFESYTASGDGKFGSNLQNIRLMKEKDMGVFIISPYDKGGRLYAPSKKLRSLTLPELEPIRYGSLWLWNHDNHDVENAPTHTMTVGAARPSDLDQPAVAAYLYRTRKEEMQSKVQIVSKKIYKAEVEALGLDWINTWYEGIPNCSTTDDAYQFGQILSLYNMIKAWGMLNYAKDRYETFDNNLAKWNFDMTTKDNIWKIGKYPAKINQRDETIKNVNYYLLKILSIHVYSNRNRRLGLHARDSPRSRERLFPPFSHHFGRKKSQGDGNSEIHS